VPFPAHIAAACRRGSSEGIVQRPFGKLRLADAS
jgi:hypothetical protein